MNERMEGRLKGRMEGPFFMKEWKDRSKSGCGYEIKSK